jgi:6-phosphofructokinase
MEATIEAPTMTLKEAEAEIATWETSLQDAQRALAQHEQQLGQIALATGVEAATQELLRLQVSVKQAEAGVAAATVQRAALGRAERAAHAIKLRADVIEFNRLADEAALVYNEHSPLAAAAWRRVEDYSRRASLAELSAGDIEFKLRQAAQS